MQFYDGFLAICDNFGPSQMTRFLVVVVHLFKVLKA